MKQPVCNRCGSNAVLVDAYAEWDMDAQNWTLQNTFQQAVCEACGGEASLDWKDVPDPVDAQACSVPLALAEQGRPVPQSRAEAVNLIFNAARPYEGQRYAGLPAADRTKILLTWSRCASFLEAPARPIVKHGIVDLSWYQERSEAA